MAGLAGRLAVLSTPARRLRPAVVSGAPGTSIFVPLFVPLSASFAPLCAPLCSVCSVFGVSSVSVFSTSAVVSTRTGRRTDLNSGVCGSRRLLLGAHCRSSPVPGVRMASGDASQPTEAVRLSGTELSK